MLLHRRIALLSALASCAALIACGPSPDGGRLTAAERHVASVGQVSNIDLTLAVPTGQVTYDFGFSSPLDGLAELNVRNNGSAVLSIRPTGKDLGERELTVNVRDGAGASQVVILLDVRSTVGSATLPKFQRPLGEGTSIQTAGSACAEIEILIDDQDTADVTISEVAPLIEGSVLQKEGSGAAIWRWCPTEKQRAERDRYLLTLGADDGENPQVQKRYLIVLDDPGKLGCPGDLPTIEHSAVDVRSIDAIGITATIADREGLKGAPRVRLGEKGRLGQPVELIMALESGDSRSGTWSASIPNPVATKALGEKEPLEYEIVVDDNDGLGSDCDHQVIESYSIEVTRPEELPDLPLCSPCTVDLQCGTDKDLCLPAGVLGGSFCSVACDTDSDCPSGSLCSPTELTSVDGATAKQCVPESDVCEVNTCSDSRLEPNDTRSEAVPLDPGLATDLRICPIGHLTSDEDWYEIDLEEDSLLDLGLDAATYPNLDLRIFDESGTLIAASEDWGSQDSVSRCLPAGTYTARVYSSFSGESDYSLSFAPSPMACPATDCTQDPYEDDDNAQTARLPDFEGSVYRAGGNSICSGDQDWFEAFLFEGETIYGTLAFEQTLATEDLDFLVYDSAGTLITACTAQDPSGCSSNGQSGDSGETFEYTATFAGKHFIVVNGFDGSENDYDICLALSPGLCP